MGFLISIKGSSNFQGIFVGHGDITWQLQTKQKQKQDEVSFTFREFA